MDRAVLAHGKAMIARNAGLIGAGIDQGQRQRCAHGRVRFDRSQRQSGGEGIERQLHHFNEAFLPGVRRKLLVGDQAI